MSRYSELIPDNYEIVLTQDGIINKLEPIINNITERVTKLTNEPIIGIVPILTGGIYLGTLLTTLFTIPTILTPAKLSLYGKNRAIEPSQITDEILEHSFKLKPVFETEPDLILVVDDIVDTGLTMNYIISYLKQQYPETKLLSLSAIWVSDNPIQILKPDFYLIEGTEDNWYFGFGMDYKNGVGRDYQFIGSVNRFEE